jgi:hypothetical protein
MTRRKKPGQRPGTMHIDKRAEKLLAEKTAHSDDDLLTTRELAAELGVSVQFLEIARHKGTGPSFVVLRRRLVAYRWGYVRGWLKDRTHKRTTEYTKRAKR